MWTLLALLITAVIAVQLTGVQKLIAERLQEAIAKKLGTEVSIGSVNIGLLNRVIIDDVCLKDQQQADMLKAARLSAKIELLPLMEGKIVISSAQLFGAKANLYRQSREAKPNYQFAIDSLSNPDSNKKTPIDLRINSLIIRRSAICYDLKSAPRKDDGLDLNHLSIDNFSGHIGLRRLTDDSLSIDIKRITFIEHSGLDMRQLSMKLEAGHHNARLSNLSILLPNSHISADNITASYNHDKLPETLSIEGAIRGNIIDTDDLTWLSGKLSPLKEHVSLNSLISYSDRRLAIQQIDIDTESGSLRVAGNATLDLHSGINDWTAKIDQLRATDRLSDYISTNIVDLPAPLAKLSYISMQGEASGNALKQLKTALDIDCNAGAATVNMSYAEGNHIEGRIETEAIDLAELIPDKPFGTVAGKVNVAGTLPTNYTVTGNIRRIDINSYPLNNIDLDVAANNETIKGKLDINDNNLFADIEGQYRKTDDDKAKVELNGIVRNFIPSAFHLTDKWGKARFRGDIEADFRASSFADVEGAIQLNNFSMQDGENDYMLEHLAIQSGYNDGTHFLMLDSDFAEAEINGHFDYATITQSMMNLVRHTLPTLPGLPQKQQPTDNNFALYLRMTRSDWMKSLINIDVDLQQPLTVKANVNDHNENINLYAHTPALTYNGNEYKNLKVNVSTPGDAIKCNASVARMGNHGALTNIAVNAKALNNSINATIDWHNTDDSLMMSGRLNTTTELYTNSKGQSEGHMKILPSALMINHAEWMIEPADILYSTEKLTVDHFEVHHGEQHLIVDGIASKQSNDSLIVDLNDVDVSYVLNLVNFHAVDFDGMATGKAIAKNVFGSPTFDADLEVKQFTFMDGRMGTLMAKARWNEEEEQIDINAVANDGPLAFTLINGYVSPPRHYIDLDIQANGTYIDFIHHFTKSFLEDPTGHAQGAVRLEGDLSEMQLLGQIVVTEGEAKMKPLGTRYILRNDTLNFKHDEIEFPNIPVRDEQGHIAYLGGGLHHKHLTNLTFDFDVETANFLAYDFKETSQGTFYGTVYATGDVSIAGRPGEVTINCNLTPDKGSTFVYNIATPDAISDQKFITWREKSSAQGSSESDAALFSPTTNTSLTNSNNKAGLPEKTNSISTDLRINFLINANPDATIKLIMGSNASDYISLNGSGVIQAAYYDKGPFQMFGTYTVDHGTYGLTIQNIIKKNFSFNPGGTIVFGGDPFKAALNLQAAYTVNGVSLSDLNIGNSFSENTVRVNCLMNIHGQPEAPQVDFDLDLPTVNADEKQMVRSIINGEQEMNQQVLYLLGIGRFYQQTNNSAAAEQTDQTTLAMQSFLSGTLSTQINEVLNSVIKNDDWNFGANISTGNEGWHNAEYEGIINGRLLNNRLLINGQFGYRDNATQANPSFIGDFDIRYLLFPNGNMQLKVYNQTNDRYFTRSSLNTQGIGLIMKRDFNGLRDLFGIRKEK